MHSTRSVRPPARGRHSARRAPSWHREEVLVAAGSPQKLKMMREMESAKHFAPQAQDMSLAQGARQRPGAPGERKRHVLSGAQSEAYLHVEHMVWHTAGLVQGASPTLTARAVGSLPSCSPSRRSRRPEGVLYSVGAAPTEATKGAAAARAARLAASMGSAWHAYTGTAGEPRSQP